MFVQYSRSHECCDATLTCPRRTGGDAKDGGARAIPVHCARPITRPRLETNSPESTNGKPSSSVNLLPSRRRFAPVNSVNSDFFFFVCPARLAFRNAAICAEKFEIERRAIRRGRASGKRTRGGKYLVVKRTNFILSLRSVEEGKENKGEKPPFVSDFVGTAPIFFSFFFLIIFRFFSFGFCFFFSLLVESGESPEIGDTEELLVGVWKREIHTPENFLTATRENAARERRSSFFFFSLARAKHVSEYPLHLIVFKSCCKRRNKTCVSSSRE